MTNDHPRDVLVDVFAAHEHLIPPADSVLNDLESALAARRRSRRAALAASGAVATVAAVAVAVTLASGSGATRHGATAAHRPRTASSTSADPSVGAPTAPTVYAQAPTLDFSPAWLPGIDARQTNYEVSPTDQDRGYDMKALGTTDLYVAITVYRHMSLGGPAKRDTERSITVGGRAAHESVQTGSYQLDVDLGSGRLLVVLMQDAAADSTAYGVSTVSPEELSTAGRHIARDIRYDAHAAVRPPLVLTTLPSNLQITGVRLTDEVNDSVEDTLATDYTLATGPTAKDAVYVSIGRSFTNRYLPPTAPGDGSTSLPIKPEEHGAPGRRVHGHPSLIIRGDGAVELIVKDFAPGRTAILVGRTDTVNLSDLYLIADGAHWNG